MVNRNIKMKLAKGLTTGVGVFASTFVGETVEDQFGLSGMGVGLSQMAIGAGVAVGSEQLGGIIGQRASVGNGLLEAGVEHVGYGIHGAGFAQLADELQQSGASADRVVTVNANADRNSQTSQNTSSAGADEFSLDTA